jgi:hypothetical protein
VVHIHLLFPYPHTSSIPTLELIHFLKRHALLTFVTFALLGLPTRLFHPHPRADSFFEAMLCSHFSPSPFLAYPHASSIPTLELIHFLKRHALLTFFTFALLGLPTRLFHPHPAATRAFIEWTCSAHLVTFTSTTSLLYCFAYFPH